MKEVVVFGDLPIATKVCKELMKYPEVKLAGVVLGKKDLKNVDPWPDTPILKEYSEEKNIPILNFDVINQKENNFFLGISARYSKIIPLRVINKFDFGIINFHGGLLPEFRGLYSSCHTILEQAKIGGGTIHFIDENIDTGEIISRCEFEVTIDDTSLTVFQKTQAAIFAKFQELLPFIISEEITLPIQEKRKGRYFDKNSLTGKKEIQLTDTLDEIYLKVRAFDFPGHEPAYLLYKGKKIFLTTRKT